MTPPLPAQPAQPVALCLSGGGYRAALFHLGAVRRLNELGILGKVDVVSSVSGGSILAALLASAVRPWPAAGERIEDFDATVCRPLRAFTKRNIRTAAILRRVLPWNWRTRAVEGLAKQYRSHLTKLELGQVGTDPAFVLCASDIPFGVNWVFDSGAFGRGRQRVGDYKAGYLAEPSWSLARAVAASSCFPPVFNPMLLRLDPEDLHGGSYRAADRPALVSGIGLSDGGVYDNMGLEPVWEKARVVLVSDGGAVFPEWRDGGLVSRLTRYSSVAGRQGSSLRKRWLISRFEEKKQFGTYWGLGTYAAKYADHDPAAYGARVVDEVISRVRTDLDRFSDAEQDVLENHGYLLADAAARTHLTETGLLDDPVPPGAIPHPEWMDEGRVRQALADSNKVKPLGRGFSLLG